MKLNFFVSFAGANSGKPAEAQNQVRLHLEPKSDKLDDPNGQAFPDPAKKSGSIEMQGLSDELQAAFRAGKRVTVTFDVE